VAQPDPEEHLYQRIPQEAARTAAGHDGVEDWELARAQPDTADGTRSAEDLALERLPDARLTNAFNQLPYDFRLAVYLADVEGFAYREIADIMRCPVGTVMSRLHRGRSRLRELLAETALVRA
jgi:RNA polymerase sigma-70 factor (ECF subfamily)